MVGTCSENKIQNGQGMVENDLQKEFGRGDNFSAQVCKKKGGGLSALILMGEQFCLTISREFLDMHVYVEKPTCIHV